MMTFVDHLIIGTGVAGATAAKRLCELGSESVMLVGAEVLPPYKRPRLSKQYLRGEHSVDEMLVDSAEAWKERGVQLRLGLPITDLDPVGRIATFADGAQVTYGSALLATGSKARSLGVPGATGPRVHTLRTMADSDAIRAQVTRGTRVVVIGGSFNGCEVAASLAALGANVTMVALEAVPFERILGSFLGQRVAQILNDNGCNFIGGTSVDRVETDPSGRGVVVTSDQRALPFDVLIACVGAIPDLDLARVAGVELSDGGVACDSRMRTSAEGLYVAGDIAAYESRTYGRRLRLERFEAAWSQSRTAAANMLGQDIVHDDRVPFFHSELHDWFELSFVGLNLEWDREFLCGDPATGSYSVWYLKGNDLAGAAFVGDTQDQQRATAAGVLRSEQSVEEALAAQSRVSELLVAPTAH